MPIFFIFFKSVIRSPRHLLWLRELIAARFSEQLLAPDFVPCDETIGFKRQFICFVILFEGYGDHPHHADIRVYLIRHQSYERPAEPDPEITRYPESMPIK